MSWLILLRPAPKWRACISGANTRRADKPIAHRLEQDATFVTWKGRSPAPAIQAFVDLFELLPEIFHLLLEIRHFTPQFHKLGLKARNALIVRCALR